MDATQLRARRTPRLRGPAALAAALVVAACEGGPTDPGREANVTVYDGAGVTVTDHAVLVGGIPLIDLGGGVSAIFFQHAIEYSYGGPDPDAPVNQQLWDESWYMDLGRSVLVDERGDTIFRRALDFGDVSLEGSAAFRFHEDEPQVTHLDDRVRVLENYLLYRVLIFAFRANRDGSTVTFVHEPFYERMVDGEALDLVATGSQDVQPTTASLTVHEGPHVVGLANGDALPFNHERPVLAGDAPLMVELDRPLDARSGLLRLYYAPPSGVDVDRQAATEVRAVFGLHRTTDRIIVPASAIARLAEEMEEEEGTFVLRVSEYLVQDRVMRIQHIADGADELTGALRASHFTIYVRIRR